MALKCSCTLPVLVSHLEIGFFQYLGKRKTYIDKTFLWLYSIVMPYFQWFLEHLAVLLLFIKHQYSLYLHQASYIIHALYHLQIYPYCLLLTYIRWTKFRKPLLICTINNSCNKLTINNNRNNKSNIWKWCYVLGTLPIFY